jgi:hypothetical protein
VKTVKLLRDLELWSAENCGHHFWGEILAGFGWQRICISVSALTCLPAAIPYQKFYRVKNSPALMKTD